MNRQSLAADWIESKAFDKWFKPQQHKESSKIKENLSETNRKMIKCWIVVFCKSNQIKDGKENELEEEEGKGVEEELNLYHKVGRLWKLINKYVRAPFTARSFPRHFSQIFSLLICFFFYSSLLFYFILYFISICFCLT